MATENEKLTLVKVSGMDCNHCKNSVEVNLKKLPEIQTVEADLSTQTVRIEGENVKMDSVREIVESLGYKFIGKADQ